MNRWTVLLVTALLGVMVTMGCSSGGGNPISPNADPALTGGTPHNGAGVQTHLWGYWDCTINLETQEVEIVRNRTAQFSANVVDFLNDNPAGLGFDILETPIEAEWIDVDINVSLTHPLPGLPQYDGYDVKGVFCSDASASLAYNSALEYPVLFGTDQFMLDDPDDDDGGGPDGYTRWFNEPEFYVSGVLGYTEGIYEALGYNSNATLNSYKYFADGLGEYDDLWTWLNDNPSTFGVFGSGQTNTRNYYLRFPGDGTVVNYGYAVVASWLGEEPEHHPAPAPETACVTATQTDNAYWVSDTSSGGYLLLDLTVWNWDLQGQPSVIYVESDAIGGSVMVDAGQLEGDPSDPNFSTYTFDALCTNLAPEGNEYWVICEYPDYNYGNEFGVPNDAETDALAAFFRFDMSILDYAPCPIPDVQAIDPVDAMEGNIVNATITTDDVLVDDVHLDAWLSMTGETDILGANVTFVDGTTLTADFDLTGVTLGLWSVNVVNGCDSPPGVGADMFEVLLSTDALYVIDDGDIPDTYPPGADNIHFTVVGPTTMGFNGVYYFGSNFELRKFPLDYSADSTLHYALQGLSGYSGYQWFGGPNLVGKVELDASGGIICTAYGTTIMWSTYQCNQAISWWPPNTGFATNALVLSSSWGRCRSRDVEAEFSAFGTLWGHYGLEADFQGTVETIMVGVGYPYGTTSYLTGWGIDWAPLDETPTGSLDGEVSDTESYRLAIDSDPHGNTPGFNFIQYYLEGDNPWPYAGIPSSADDYTIEVFENIKSSLGSAHILLTTITETSFTGEPVDISVVNGYNILDGGNAESNWLAVLEDNGDSTWNMAIFEQDGTLVERLENDSAQIGDVIGCDVDQASQEIHVWADNAGTLTYAILGWP